MGIGFTDREIIRLIAAVASRFVTICRMAQITSIILVITASGEHFKERQFRPILFGSCGLATRAHLCLLLAIARRFPANTFQ